MLLQDRWTDRCRIKWSLCAAMLRRQQSWGRGGILESPYLSVDAWLGKMVQSHNYLTFTHIIMKLHTHYPWVKDVPYWFLTGLQSKSGLWIGENRLFVRLSGENRLSGVNNCVSLLCLAIAFSLVSHNLLMIQESKLVSLWTLMSSSRLAQNFVTLTLTLRFSEHTLILTLACLWMALKGVVLPSLVCL